MNNQLLADAAFRGAFVGATTGGSPPGTVSGTPYASLVAACTTLATAIDSAIPNDGTISAGGGVALPPTTAAIQTAQLNKTGLLAGLVSGANVGRFLADTTAGDYAPLVAGIVQQYNAAVAGLP